MKTVLLIIAFPFLTTAIHASAQTGFKNPDGSPNAIALEPLFGYIGSGPFDADALELGLRVTKPISERITLRAVGIVGSGEYFAPQAELVESDGRDWVINRPERREYEQISVRISVKIWLGADR